MQPLAREMSTAAPSWSLPPVPLMLLPVYVDFCAHFTFRDTFPVLFFNGRTHTRSGKK
jgi:hypothetical protein